MSKSSLAERRERVLQNVCVVMVVRGSIAQKAYNVPEVLKLTSTREDGNSNHKKIPFTPI